MVGKTATLQVTGTKKTIKWSTSKKTVATVTSKGKVTAVAAGKATITATVSSKKYTCSVTVKEPANPYLADAPFDAEEYIIGDLSMVIPTGWTITPELLDDDYVSVMMQPNDINLTSVVMMDISIGDTAVDASHYAEFKEQYCTTYTQESLMQEWEDVFRDTPYEITSFEQTDFFAPFNNVYNIDYTLKVEDVISINSIYQFYIDNFIIEAFSYDRDNLDLTAIVDYMISSIIVK